MNKIEKTLYLTLIFGFLGTAVTGQDQEAKIGIDVSYPIKISPHLKIRIDSTIEVTTARFNAERHAYKIATTKTVDQPCINVDFTKAKLATKSQRNIAYVVNLIAPVYVPMHKINSSVSYSAGEQAKSGSSTPVKSRAMVLLANLYKREDKLLQKYADKLYQALVNLNPGYQDNISAFL